MNVWPLGSNAPTKKMLPPFHLALMRWNFSIRFRFFFTCYDFISIFSSFASSFSKISSRRYKAAFSVLKIVLSTKTRKMEEEGQGNATGVFEGYNPEDEKKCGKIRLLVKICGRCFFFQYRMIIVNARLFPKNELFWALLLPFGCWNFCTWLCCTSCALTLDFRSLLLLPTSLLSSLLCVSCLCVWVCICVFVGTCVCVFDCLLRFMAIRSSLLYISLKSIVYLSK